MPPKKRKAPLTTTSTPQPGTPFDPSQPPSGAQTPLSQAPPPPSLAEQLSYLHEPRPFKNPYYGKNINRRAKTLKAVLNAEKERGRVERERKRAEAETVRNQDGEQGSTGVGKMEVDGEASMKPSSSKIDFDEDTSYAATEAAPSVLPHPHYCDITGLEAPYTDPATRLRYHDKSVYEIIKGLNTTTARDYLAARGVMPIVK